MRDRIKGRRLGNIYYQGFTEDEILQFEGYLDRIRINLEERRAWNSRKSK
ncbi:MAG: hypothetical protein K6E30_08680 [Lachnospiraceae bacterium]|nr:hypothetical protein [Lachnospiraceae bacterium]